MFFGGLIGGAIGVLLWAQWRGFLGWTLLDAAAPSIAIGYAVGRLGCQLSGDGDYGEPSDLPWAMAYPDGTVPTTDEVHPTPIYETLSMGLVTLLLWHWRDRFAPGVLFGLYLIFAGLERFLVEFIRRNDAVVAGLTVPQLFSLAMLARRDGPGGRAAATCRGPLPPERRAERGGGAQHQRDRRAGRGARLSGQLDAGDAGRARRPRRPRPSRRPGRARGRAPRPAAPPAPPARAGRRDPGPSTAIARRHQGEQGQPDERRA